MADPLFPSILALLPFSDAGSMFTDKGPRAVPVSVFGSGGAILTQDNTRTLFGLPTLHIERTAAQPTKFLQLDMLNDPLPSSSPLCVEWWFSEDTPRANVSAVPRHWQWRGSFPNGSYGGAPVFCADTIGEQGVAPRVPSAAGVYAFAPGQWHFAALQLTGDGNAHFSLNGALLFSGAGSLINSRDWQMKIALGGNANPSQAMAFRFWLSQLRVTAADRYGNTAAPVPVGPWELA